MPRAKAPPLKLAQTLFRWAVRRGYLRESPFAGVQPVGLGLGSTGKPKCHQVFHAAVRRVCVNSLTKRY